MGEAEDLAVRRRFAFVTLHPDRAPVKALGIPLGIETFDRLAATFVEHAADDAVPLLPGQAYYLTDDEVQLRRRFRYELIPLLDEYLTGGMLGAAAAEVQTVRDGLADHVERWRQAPEAIPWAATIVAAPFPAFPPSGLARRHRWRQRHRHRAGGAVMGRRGPGLPASECGGPRVVGCAAGDRGGGTGGARAALPGGPHRRRAAALGADGACDVGVGGAAALRLAGVGQVLEQTGWAAMPEMLAQPLVPGSGREIPPWVIAGPALRRLRDLLARLRRGYRMAEEVLPGVRGHVDWTRYAVRQMPRGAWGAFPCRFPDLGQDPLLPRCGLRWSVCGWHCSAQRVVTRSRSAW